MDGEEVDLTLRLESLWTRYEVALSGRVVFASDFVKKADGTGKDGLDFAERFEERSPFLVGIRG